MSKSLFDIRGFYQPDPIILEGMDQKKFSAGAKAMKAYAQKNGGVDKKDFMEVSKLLDQIGRVNILQAGQLLSRLNRLVDGMDTDVRERIFIELKKVGLVESVNEEFNIDEGIEQTMIRMLHSKFQELSKVIDPKSATAKKISAKLGAKSEFSEIKGYMDKIEDILRELDSMASMNESAENESTAAYGKSQEKIANDKKKANIKPGELNKLAKIRAMLDKEKKK